MYQNCRNGSVKRLNNEKRPLQVLLTDQKLACFFPGTTGNLTLSDIACLLRQSGKIGSDTSFNQMPVLSPHGLDNFSVILGNHSSIRHPSSFFMLVLQNSKPSSVALARWLNRELRPVISVFKKPLVTVTDNMELKQLVGRNKMRMTGQILVNLETVHTFQVRLSSEIEGQENPDKGGE